MNRLNDRREKNENGADLFDNLLEVLRYAVFVGFFVLSIRMVFVILTHTTPVISIVLGSAVAAIAILSWWRMKWALYGFVTCIPVVSGFQMIGFMKGLPLLSIGFASIYLTWIGKRVIWEKKGIVPGTGTGNLVDVLSAIVLISLIMQLVLYPVDFVLYRLWSHSFMGQDEFLYGIDGSYILLQGLFFYRLMCLEINEKKIWRKVTPILYIQASIITFFSAYQLIFHNGGTKQLIGLYYPFDDIHSYGSYIVLLFFCFLLLTRMKDTKYRNLAVFFAPVFLGWVVLSYSRITWLAMLILGGIFSFLHLQWKKQFLVIVCCILFGIVLVNIFYADLPHSSNRYVTRFWSVVVIRNYLKGPSIIGRLVRWRTPFRIIREYPVTGSGVGTYFGLSPSYVKKEDLHFLKRMGRRSWKAQENAHNYYLQFCADLGIPALLIFLGIIFFTYKTGFAVVRKGLEESRLVKGLLFGLSAYLMTMLTGHPLLLSNQQFLFWFVIAVISIAYRDNVREGER